jgi:hypothetical protein
MVTLLFGSETTGNDKLLPILPFPDLTMRSCKS